MRHILVAWILIAWTFTILCGCASTRAPGIVAPACGDLSPVHANDYARFGFVPSAGKVHVLHIFATWSPYCQDDLRKMGQRFANKTWDPKKVEIWLLAYHNKKETHASFEKFRDGELGKTGIPASAVQLLYLDQNYKELLSTGMFKGWKGLPFALVFGKDGRLVFRGHFTMSDETQDHHYAVISGLQNENCGGAR